MAPEQEIFTATEKKISRGIHANLRGAAIVILFWRLSTELTFSSLSGMGGGKSSKSCCRGSYQLPILVVSMTLIIFLGILAGVLFIQSKYFAQCLRYE